MGLNRQRRRQQVGTGIRDRTPNGTLGETYSLSGLPTGSTGGSRLGPAHAIERPPAPRGLTRSLSRLLTWGLKKSPWVYHVNVGACNNCDIEIVNCLTPAFDIERFGMVLVATPRHADALLISGFCSRQAKPRLQEIYRQTAKPCLALCIGACACSMGIFADSYHAAGPVDKVIREVDPNAIIAYVPGCPPRPQAIIAGAVKALQSL